MPLNHRNIVHSDQIWFTKWYSVGKTTKSENAIRSYYKIENYIMIELEVLRFAKVN